MARLLIVIAAAVACLAVGATAFDENHAFRAPVVELPQLAKPVPSSFASISSRRSLLGRDRDGRHRDPSKSDWDKRKGVTGDTEKVFVQGEP